MQIYNGCHVQCEGPSCNPEAKDCPLILPVKGMLGLSLRCARLDGTTPLNELTPVIAQHKGRQWETIVVGTYCSNCKIPVPKTFGYKSVKVRSNAFVYCVTGGATPIAQEV